MPVTASEGNTTQVYRFQVCGVMPDELITSKRLATTSCNRSNREHPAGHRVSATKKPDADNMLKSLKDAFNGIVWQDNA